MAALDVEVRSVGEHACVSACVYACVSACVNACVKVFVYACGKACVSVCGCDAFVWHGCAWMWMICVYACWRVRSLIVDL